MLPPELEGVTVPNIIEVLAEDCLAINDNIVDNFKVHIWVENGTILRYRITDKDDTPELFQLPDTIARHSEALYFVIKNQTPTKEPFSELTVNFKKDEQGWRMETKMNYKS